MKHIYAHFWICFHSFKYWCTLLKKKKWIWNTCLQPGPPTINKYIVISFKTSQFVSGKKNTKIVFRFFFYHSCHIINFRLTCNDCLQGSELLKVPVIRLTNFAKFSWVCAKSWDVYTQTIKIIYFYLYVICWVFFAQFLAQKFQKFSFDCARKTNFGRSGPRLWKFET